MRCGRVGAQVVVAGRRSVEAEVGGVVAAARAAQRIVVKEAEREEAAEAGRRASLWQVGEGEETGLRFARRCSRWLRDLRAEAGAVVWVSWAPSWGRLAAADAAG